MSITVKFTPLSKGILDKQVPLFYPLCNLKDAGSARVRVISGAVRGKRLVSFRGEGIRPTADRVKEALFNIIISNFGPMDDKKVLDLFAGTGSLGIEALSRGAAKAFFVDESPESVRTLKKNIDNCGFSDSSEILQVTVESGIRLVSKRGERFDLVFLDPPYEKGYVEKALQGIIRRDILEQDALVVAEHSVRERPSEDYNGLILKDRRRYGDTEVSFFIKSR